MTHQKMLFKSLTAFRLLFAGSFQEEGIDEICSFQVVCLYNKPSFLPRGILLLRSQPRREHSYGATER